MLFESSSDEDIDINKLCNYSDHYEIVMNYEDNSARDLCLVCGEFGRDNELLLRCVLCSQ